MKRCWLFCLMLLSTCIAYSQGVPFIKSFTPDDYHAHNRNFDVAIGNDGMVFIANFEGLLYYDKTQWNIIHTPGATRVTVLHRDSKNNIWCGGYNYFGKIKRKPNGEVYLQRVGDVSTFRGEVIEISETEGKAIFLVDNGYIYQVDDNDKITIRKQVSEERLNIGLSDVVDMNMLNNNQAVVLSDITREVSIGNGLKAAIKKGQGIIIRNEAGKVIKTITESNGLPTNSIVWIDYDEHGQIWGATDNGIFSIAYPSAFSHFTENEGLSDEVLSITAFAGKKYIGTINGLFRLEGEALVRIPDIHYACWQMALTSRGLMVATANGVYRISSNGTISKLTSTNATAVMEDGNLFYTGELDGVFINEEDGKRRMKVSELENVSKIIRDEQGTIWLQNIFGEIECKKAGEEKFKQYKVGNGKENLLATLVRIDNQVEIISTEATTPFSYPQFSFTDNTGVIWLTNNEGKNIYRWKNNQRLDDLDILLHPFDDMTIRALFCEDKEIWIGGNSDLTVINTDIEDPALQTPPHLLIRSITLGNDSIVWMGPGEVDRDFRFGSDERNLHFSYSLEFVPLVGTTLYRHQLNDGAWSAWSEDVDVDFLNLPYGSYKFNVQARDPFGRVTDSTSVEFTISYPFYMRWYMMALYFIFLVFLVYLLIKFRLHQLEKDKIRLEKVVKDRTAEVVKQKDEIEEKSKSLETALNDLNKAQHELIRQEKMATVGKLTQGLIDRILNPLNYINNFSKLSEGLVKDIEANIEDEKEHFDEENYEDTKDVLNMLRNNLQKVGEHGQNTSRTLKAMEEMLKDRSGGIVDMNLSQLLQLNEKMVYKYYAQDIADHHIKVSFQYPHSEMPIKGNADQLSKTIMSLLGNAIYAVVKKAQREAYEPEVSLTAVTKDQLFEITIHDNGIGIENKIINKIFDPFFTTKTTGEASGVGLYLSREIIQNYGGDINVKSVKDEYSDFIITLPVLKQ